MEKAKDILKRLSIDDKIKLLSGKNFWYLNAIPQANLKSIMMTDGPHGLRKQRDMGDHLGIGNSYPATCFPTASALASTWNPSLIYKLGQTLGDECLSEEVSVLLGPGVNMKRHPLCGRNFEYFSEDPYLTGKLASAYINGVQSKGIGTSLKHFAVNNQETMRMGVDVIVDERTLREFYLKAFEMAVKESQPWTVMSSYNKINGIYASENKKLLQDILKDEWKYQGLVVTDWGANNDRVEGLIAGQDLEMPGNQNIHAKAIKKALDKGTLSESILDSKVQRIIEMMIQSNETLSQKHPDYDPDKHHQFAREVAQESIVLLKNRDDILPLNKKEKIALIGAFAKKPRYQGSGSSLINPSRISTAYDALKEKCGQEILYADGYDLSTDEVDESLINEALNVIHQADKVIIMAGLTDTYESEGFDRDHLDLPMNHNALIDAISKAHDKVVVALSNGSPVRMPWLNNVSGVLEQYLTGQASGQALIDILYGDVNPSAKLAETFPNALSEIIANQNFPGQPRQVLYKEGLYVGYRAYDKQQVKPLFDFGYGLSYTSFEYSQFTIKKDDLNQVIHVTLDIKNTGQYSGKEIVQVYVSKKDSLVYRPNQELKAFDKVSLAPGQSKELTLKIDYHDLKIYQDGFKLEDGEYMISINASSRDVRYQEIISIDSEDSIVNDHLDLYKNLSSESIISDEDYKALLGYDIPPYPSSKPFTLNSTIGEIRKTFIGEKIYKIMYKKMAYMIESEDNDTTKKMIEKSIKEMPFRSLVVFSGGDLSIRRAQGMLDLMNKRFIRGLIKLILG
ncbi:glycoside hydrolase family 3 C-terminal domain-containing protein [Mycoplasmatota bacterium]|nr:glycoside hydrolase family 3 C-terminal domain-containing protein [Mycoplasmatota bacterium]